ncbi:MAG TPA: M6 family metalloprotease domain-containing protein [Pyrinomonadaceae bacterium]|nr:M6 family metalloprotease domain-containing protein [Pyrinomonadaceae bacterium]
MATLFNGRIFTFTQPDGSTIQLRGFGDQHYAVFETLDGYTVTKNPTTGYYEVAQLSPDGNALQPTSAPGDPLDGAAAGVPRGLRVRRESAMAAARESALITSGRRCDQRREERRQQMRAMRAMATAGGPLLAPPQRQTVGDFVGLCLLVDFSDSPATIPREEVDRFCNKPGYDGFGNNGSVFDFFRDNSIGRCRYTNVVAPYYRALHPKTYYTDESIPQVRRAVELINEALTHHKANGFDFSQLTADNQGFVYAMNVYYAGPVTNNWAQGLWPHSHHLGSPVSLRPGASAFDYQFTAMGSELELGTFCHENGHMLCDYPDLYDYGNESSGVGLFCLMCAGNFTEKNPLPISAYLKRLSGWANNVTTLEHGSQVTLAAGSNDFAIYSRGGREYYLIENRRKFGRDVTLPDEGLAIWHVDEDGDNSHEQMTTASHYELSLVQADGLFQFERQRGKLGDADDLYAGPGARFADDTAPNSKWWNGTSSNLTIDQISAAGASVSFRCLLSDAVTPPQTLNPTSTPNRTIPDNNSTGISDTINIAQAVTISSIKVSVDITHTFRGDLRVTLTTPLGTVIELHPKGRGGNADDLKVTFDENTLPALATLRGRGAQGAWQLTVQDLAAADTGRLNRWGLEISTAAAVVAPVELQESPGTPIPDFPDAGIERGLATTSTARVGSVEVSVDISHTWIGDLRVSLVSPTGTEVLLKDSTGEDADNLVRTFTATNTPGMGALAGQTVTGTWRLRVSDRAAQDVGKLNSWRLLIKPPAA